MITFTISCAEAMDMIVENLMAWHWDPDLSAFAVLPKGLDYMSNEELEDVLHQHIRIEEQQNGFDDGLLSCVRFNIISDYDWARLRTNYQPVS